MRLHLVQPRWIEPRGEKIVGRGTAELPQRPACRRRRAGSRPAAYSMRARRREHRALETRDLRAQGFDERGTRQGAANLGNRPRLRNGRGEVCRSGRAGGRTAGRTRPMCRQQGEGGVSRRCHVRRLATRERNSAQTMLCVLFLFYIWQAHTSSKKNTEGTEGRPRDGHGKKLPQRPKTSHGAGTIACQHITLGTGNRTRRECVHDTSVSSMLCRAKWDWYIPCVHHRQRRMAFFHLRPHGFRTRSIPR